MGNSSNLPEFQCTKDGLSINVPAGLRLSITSWENDGDDYRTVVVNGLTEEDVRFYLELAADFRSDSGSCSGRPGDRGNVSVPAYDLYTLVKGALGSHPALSAQERSVWEKALESFQKSLDAEDPDRFSVDGGEIYDLLCEKVLAEPVQYEYGHCRVVESFQVLRIEEPVILVTPVQDVSASFALKTASTSTAGPRF